MNASLIAIGDELLIGQTLDTNSNWIAQQLNAIGIHVKEIKIVADDEQEILHAIEIATRSNSIIIMTGGLGPTSDDLTKPTLCKYFKTKLVLNKEVEKDIENYFSKRGKELTVRNRQQAEIPANCIPLKNSLGTAPGMWFEENGKVLVSLPGVPFEMKKLMKEHVITRLKQKFSFTKIIHKNILTFGIGESFLADKIVEWQNQLPKEIKIAYLPSLSGVKIRLSANESLSVNNEKIISEQVEMLSKIISQYIFGYDDTTLQQVVGSLLLQQKKTIGIAESCTGGYLSHLITSIPGSSIYFKGSTIPYSNELKQNLLGVQESILINHGAVSEECVIEMVKGTINKLQVDYAISISGIAGPSGGTIEKPIGTVWIAVGNKKKIITKKFQFSSDRLQIIELSANAALNEARKLMIE